MDVKPFIKNLFFKEVVAGVTARIVTSLPFLGMPVIGFFFNALVNYIAKKLWDEMEILGAFIEIDFKEQEHLSKYLKAEQKLKHVLEAELSESKKNEAINEYTTNLRNLIRINVK